MWTKVGFLAPLCLALGCSTAPARSTPTSGGGSRAVFAAMRRGERPGSKRPPRGAVRGRTVAVAPTVGFTPVSFVEESLRSQGARFGTDGRPQSLYQYIRRSQVLVPPREVRPGDVVFFNLAGEGCGDHVGLVERVEPDGRITFRERRDGLVRTSFVQPAEPRLRRDAEGRVLNTFLRPKRPEDAPGTRYFAGEMLCAVGRVTGP